MGPHESIYHYWLIPPSLAQPDILSAVDINHDFNIMDPYSGTEGKNVWPVSILVSSCACIEIQSGDAESVLAIASHAK